MRKRTLRKPHLDYDLLYELYINKNLRREEVFKELQDRGIDCTCSIVFRDIKYYNIVKPKELQKERIKQTSLKLYGVEHPKLAKEVENKRKQTCLDKYGTDHPLKSVSIKQKVAKTCLEKYGSTCYFSSQEGKEKIHKTMLKEYGVDNIFKSQQFKDYLKQYNLDNYGVEHSSQRSDVIAKAKQTFLEHYGVDNPLKSKIVLSKVQNTNQQRYGGNAPACSDLIKDKMRQTCLNKYGVENIFLSSDLKYNIKKQFSHPNNEFALFLDNQNISYSREFVIGMKSYDFKVNNYLIEINPFATHNSTWGAYGDYKGIDKYYHYNKSKLAFENGYICIHVFDWMDKSKVIDILKGNLSFDFKQKECPDCYVYNSKTKISFLRPDNYELKDCEVIIYDDGNVFHI